MKKNKTLAELVSGVMNHPECPDDLYNAMADALVSLKSWSGPRDSSAWVEFALDRYKEAEEKGH
jgi:hypothetical protein